MSGGAPAGQNAMQNVSDEDMALMAQYGDDPELLAAIKMSMQEQ